MRSPDADHEGPPRSLVEVPTKCGAANSGRARGAITKSWRQPNGRCRAGHPFLWPAGSSADDEKGSSTPVVPGASFGNPDRFSTAPAILQAIQIAKLIPRRFDK